MNKLRSCALLMGAIAWPCLAHAEDGKDKDLTFELELSAKPAIGTSLEPGSGNDIIDQSEYGATVTVKRQIGAVALSFAPAATYSPGYYSGADPESALAFTLGLDGAGLASGSGWSANWTLSYEFKRNFSGAFDTGSSIDHTFGAQIKFGNALHLAKDSAGQPCTDESKGVKIAYTITPALAYVASTKPDERRFAPSIAGEVKVPIRKVDFTASGKIERRMFSDKRLITGARQNDWRLTATAGLELNRLLSLPAQWSISVGGKYVRNWSNDAASRFERSFFTPGVSFTLKK